MKNNTLRGAIVWFLAIFIISLFSLATIAAYEPEAENISSEYGSQTPKYEVEAKKEKTFREALLTDPVAFFTMVLAIFTMGLAGVTVALWQEAKRASEEQASLTRKSIEHASANARAAADAAKAAFDTLMIERAWVCFENFNTIKAKNSKDIDTGIVHDEIIGVQIVLKNAGRSPASDIAIFVKSEIRPMKFDGAPSFRVEREQRVGVVVGPAHTLTSAPLFVFGEDLKAFKAREVKMFCYCYVSYASISATKGNFFTEICLEVIFNGEIQLADGSIGVNLQGIHVGPQNSYA